MKFGAWLYMGLCVPLQYIATDEPAVRAPFGIHMCDHLCHHTVGCWMYVYSISRLDCRMPTSSDGRFPNDAVVININSVQTAQTLSKALGRTCRHDERVLYSRTKQRHCVPWRQTAFTQALAEEVVRAEIPMRRLLVVPKHTRMKKHMREFLLTSQREKEYPFIKASGIQSLAYIPKLRRVLIGEGKVKMLRSCSLDHWHNVVLKMNISTRAIVVDDQKELVFFASDDGLWRMRTDGASQTMLGFKRQDIRSLSLDCRHLRVYVVSVWMITSATYQGNSKHVFPMKGPFYASVFDHVRQMLYYTSKQKLFKMPVSNKRVFSVTSFRGQPKSLTLHGNVAYVTFGNSEEIGEMNLENVHYRTLITMRFGHGYSLGLLICLVP